MPASSRAARAHEISLALTNFLRLAASLMLTWAVAIIVKIKVPAHLGPVRQGHLGFAESFASMFLAFIGFGLDTYVSKEVPVRPKCASEFVGGVFALRALSSVVLIASMIVTLLVTHRQHEIVLAAIVFSLTQMVMSFNATLQAFLQATMRVGRLAIANVVCKIIWGTGVLIGVYCDAPLYALAAPMLLSELLRFGALATVSRQVGDLRYRIDVKAARQALRESIPYYVSSVAMNVLGNLGLSVLGFISHDEREVGWFASIQNIVILCLILMPIIQGVFMPLVSRAFGRSEREGMTIVRRGIEALIIVIMPLTVMVSAGSDLLVALAFGPKFAPAALGLSILSLVFVLTYLDSMLGMALTILNRGWSVTIISVASVFVTGGSMFICVPIARRVFGTGGECAGAALSMILSEIFVAASMMSRFESSPLDARSLRTVGKSAVLGLVVILLNRHLMGLGVGRSRLVIDGLVYLVGAVVLQVVRVDDARRLYYTMRSRRGGAAALEPAVSTKSLG